MKKITRYTLVLLLTGLLAACDKDEPDYSYAGPWFISFASSQIEVPESSTEIINLEVQLVAPVQTSAVALDFSVSSETLQEGVDYELVNETNTLSFEPGEFKQSIQIKVIDNLESSGDQSLNVQLTSNSAGFEIGKPGPDKLNSTCEMIIVDDDCPYTLETFSGNITGYETANWWTDVASPFTFTPVEEMEPGVIKYKIKGFWYAQLEDYAWIGEGETAEYYDVTAIINYKDAAAPTITLLEEPCAKANWDDGTSTTYTMKPVEDQPIKMSVCGRTLEFSYTILGTSWAHNYVFTLKFNFNE